MDQGSAFTSRKRNRLCDEVDVYIQPPGIEIHNALGSGELYHEPIRKIYNTILQETATIDEDFALRAAIKAINDTLRSKGLVLSLLVFLFLPRFPRYNYTMQNLKLSIDVYEFNHLSQELKRTTNEQKARRWSADTILDSGASFIIKVVNIIIIMASAFPNTHLI